MARGLKCFSLAVLVAAFVCAAPRAHAEGGYRTIVIDAGHGGFDRGGGPGQVIAEKDKTLDVALRLRTILRNAGYRVVLTRDSDVFIPLGTRVAIANSERDAIFVSIHFNSATRLGASGIETYFYSTESAPLAASIHSRVMSGSPGENRGVRRRGFFVLRRTAIPAVLVECGFLTNPTEGSLAQTTSYRQKLADEIARGILARPTVASRTSYTNRSSSVNVGPQPFLDQRFVSRSHRTTRHSAKANRRTHRKRALSTKKKLSTISHEG